MWETDPPCILGAVLGMIFIVLDNARQTNFLKEVCAYQQSRSSRCKQARELLGVGLKECYFAVSVHSNARD